MRAVLLVLAVLVGTTPALAQRETGTRLEGRPAQLPDHGSMEDRARIWMERYVDCMVRRDPARVANALNAQIGDDGPLEKLFFKNQYDNCLSSGSADATLLLNKRLLRGALYADRVTSLASRIAPNLASALPIVYPDNGDPHIGLVRFGECVVRAEPVAALKYVSAHAASGLERKSLVALRPHLGGCLDAGQTIELSASVLEAALAEGIWRMTQRPNA